MNGLLVRVGIDSTDGGWNAPVIIRSGEFAYITITEAKPARPGLLRSYDEFVPALSRFGVELPRRLLGISFNAIQIHFVGEGNMSRSTRNTGKAWSPADVSQLRKLARENTPTRVIGLKLSRTEDAVRSKASEKDISLKPTNQSPYGTKK